MENKINWGELFEKFLIDNNAFSQFCSNLVEESVVFSEYVETIYPINYMIDCFIWNRTKEGFSFWNHLYVKWYEIYKENKLE